MPRYIVEEPTAGGSSTVRLEMGQVLVSWALPDGLPDRPADDRAAVRLRDGHVGDGPVAEPWDAGTYENVTPGSHGRVRPLPDAVAAGRLKLWLSGWKLRGTWTLTRDAEGSWVVSRARDASGAARRRDPG